MIAEATKPHPIEYYSLALLGLSPNNIDYYIRARLLKNSNKVLIETNYPNEVLAKTAISTTTNSLNCGYVLELPEKWQLDVAKIRLGQYSQMSDEAKQKIKKHSCLSYKVPTARNTVLTDKYLLALDKEPLLRTYWENKIGLELPADAELADGPTETNFI
jgi:hypothetical protein